MKKKLLLFIVTLILVLVGFIIYRIVTIKSPVEDLNVSRKILAKAELFKADSFAKDYYKNAKNYYDSAMFYWSLENEKIIVFRNFSMTMQFARMSAENSEKAISSSKIAVSGIEKALEKKLNIIDKRIKDFDLKYKYFPYIRTHNNEFVKSKMQFQEAKNAFKRNDYQTCRVKLDSAEIGINQLSNIYEELTKKYFLEQSKWAKWIEQAISYSKKNKTYCIVIDKFKRECKLYKSGECVNTFEIELGKNWIGNKTYQGDKKTPEGLYEIVSKKEKGSTKYYKALLLNYPNEVDKKTFVENKKKGVIGKNAKIGNLIEIHGNGGKGIDWTDGCVALKDSDMDILYSKCTNGAKVTIVGSLKTYNELFAK